MAATPDDVTQSLPPIAGAVSAPPSQPAGPPAVAPPQLPQYTPPDTSQYTAEAARQKKRAQAEENAEEQAQEGEAALDEEEAGQLSQNQKKFDALFKQAPAPAVAYQTALRTAPIVTILAALGGKAAGISGVGMLGALNGMVSGINEGSLQKYQQSLDAWKQQLEILKERNAEQEHIYEVMLDAYKNRADAAQKARDFALAMTHDSMSQAESAKKDSIDLFKARAQMMAQAERAQELLETAAYRWQQATNNLGNPQTQDSISSAIANYQMAPFSGYVLRTAEGQQIMADVYKKNPNYDATIYNAKNRERSAAGTMGGKISVSEKEIEQYVPIIEQASAQVPRGQFVAVNRLLQMSQTQISNPQLKRLKIAINSMLNAYDALAARGGTDQDKRAEVRSLITAADSPQALDAGLKQFLVESKAAMKAVNEATGQEDEEGGKTVTRRGTYQGRPVVQYSDGTVSYAD